MTSSLHFSRQVEPKSLIPRGIDQITHCWRHDQAQDPDVTIAQRRSSGLLRQIAAKDLRQITSKATDLDSEIECEEAQLRLPGETI
jgi:hypothetical protein